MRRKLWRRAWPALATTVLGGSIAVAQDRAPRTVDVTAEAIAEGEALYAVCAACHGADGEGTLALGARLNSETFLAAASDEFLIRTISEGRPGTTMVPWGAAYSEEQVSSLVALIRSWSDVEPMALDESDLDGDVSHGAETFAGICSSCHGTRGEGFAGGGVGSGIGRAAFLDVATDGFLRAIINDGKSGTAMRAFDGTSPATIADLTPQDIEDVIAFLRQNAW